jgi:hypothetical protein
MIEAILRNVLLSICSSEVAVFFVPLKKGRRESHEMTKVSGSLVSSAGSLVKSMNLRRLRWTLFLVGLFLMASALTCFIVYFTSRTPWEGSFSISYAEWWTSLILWAQSFELSGMVMLSLAWALPNPGRAAVALAVPLNLAFLVDSFLGKANVWVLLPVYDPTIRYFDFECLALLLGVVTFATLSARKQGGRKAILRAIESVSILGLVLGLEIFFFDRVDFNLYVVTVLEGTAFSWITNEFITVVSGALLFLCFVVERLKGLGVGGFVETL